MANRPSQHRTFNGSADFQRDDCPRPWHAPEGHLDLCLSSCDVGYVAEDFNQDPLGIWDDTENLFGHDQSFSGTEDLTEVYFDFDKWSRQDQTTVTTETSFEGGSLLHSAPSATRDQDVIIALDNESRTTEGTVIVAAPDTLAISLVNQSMRDENFDPQRYPKSEDIDNDVTDSDSQEIDQAQSRRRRIVKNPEETAQTRVSKACVSCKVQKRTCKPYGHCPRCVTFSAKVGSIYVVCHRVTALSAIIGTREGRWPLADRPLRMPAREQCRSLTRIDLHICRCASVLCKPLSVKACEYTELGSDLCFYHMLGFAPDESPSDDELYGWGKRDVEAHANADENFPNCLEGFLSLFVDAFHELYVDSDHSRAGKFHKLMVNTQRMAWMVKIWATEHFSVNGVPLSTNDEPVWTFLRERAQKAITPLERQILEQFDLFLKSTETKITTEDLDSNIGSAMVIAIWVSLWQMMLTYRGLLQRALPNDIATFQQQTNVLFENMVVMYSQLFRKAELPRCVESAIDRPEIFGKNPLVWHAFRKAMGLRRLFYRELADMRFPNSQDQLLKTHVVTWEEMILNRRTTKSAERGRRARRQ